MQIFLQFIVCLWNFLMEFYFSPSPLLVQASISSHLDWRLSLLPSLCFHFSLLDPNLCARQSGLCQIGTRSYYILKIPQGLLLSTLKSKRHSTASMTLHESHITYFSQIIFCSSLCREWPSFTFRLLNKWSVFIPYGFCVLCLILLLAGMTFPQTSHGSLSTSLGLQHAYHPWEEPTLPVIVKMAHAPMPTPPVLRSIPASVLYLCFRT